MCTTYTWQFTNMYICSSDVRPQLNDSSFPVTRRWSHENIVGGRGKCFYEQNHFTNLFYKMLRLIPAPAPVHFTNLERGGSVLPETINHLTTALLVT